MWVHREITLDPRPRGFHLVTCDVLGALPELDSLAVVELIQALEENFDFIVDDAEFSGELFETVGTLADFVESKIPS